MTSAAAPAMSGADWLVPPNASVVVFVGQPLPAGLHSASEPYPSATRSTMRLFGATPPEDSGVMFWLIHLPNPKAWALSRRSLVAPASITSGSVDGEDMVPESPLSPEETTT